MHIGCSPRCMLPVVCGMALWSGCGGGPEAVDIPEIDPERAAAQAVEAYDTNGDNVLSSEEAADSPGLAAAHASLDADNDGQVSPEEIAERIRLYTRRGAGAKSLLCTVTMDGDPLGGATVKLVPEEFLGEEVLPAEGVSAADGTVALSVDPRALPDDLAGIPAVHLGIYRVQITHPEREIPRRFNEETTLGCEVGPTTRHLAFNLTNR